MNELEVIEYEEQRVLTTQQLAEAYGTVVDVLTRNFNRNKDKYTKGKHYIALEGEEKNAFVNLGQVDRSLKKAKTLYLWTEQGALLHAKSLNTDKAWEVYDKLVESYFRVRQIANDLSPQMRMLYQMCDQLAQAERQANEAKRIAGVASQTASKAAEGVENIKEAVKPVIDNWRPEINAKFNRIQKSTGEQFSILRSEMYKELEQRAGCNLTTRLKNKKKRLESTGCSKSEIIKLNKMDIIEQDKKLREIFSKIISECEIKYCA